MNIEIRNVLPEDLPHFFQFQLDPEANRMAAFTSKDPSDRAAFDAHWKKILTDETLVSKTITVDGEVVGSLGKFVMFDRPQVTYWIGKKFWGKGIATAALLHFLAEYESRPLYAQAAADNVGSRRVLEKCGFVKVDVDRGFSNARGEEIDEYIFKLDR
jgi:RimJ/RimL family protein N-acetyltransferase